MIICTIWKLFDVLAVELGDDSLVWDCQHHLTQLVISDFIVAAEVENVKDHPVKVLTLPLHVPMHGHQEIVEGYPHARWIL